MFSGDYLIHQYILALRGGQLTATRFSTLFISRLCAILSSRILETIASLLPYALSVAGAFLVVIVAWRLFRNFTRG